MARRTNISASELTGSNIYHQKNQTIYYDFITKKGYVITNSSARTFSTWQMRLPLSIIAACILILLKADPLGAILIGIAAYLAATLIFLNRYLPTLPVVSRFSKPKSLGFVRDLAAKYALPTFGFVIMMFYAMAIIITVNTFFVSKVEGKSMWISVAFIAMAVICGTFFLYIRSVKIKEKL